MKRIMVAVLLLVSAAGQATAGGGSKRHAVTPPAATVNPLSAFSASPASVSPLTMFSTPTVPRPQPVVGSVQRAGRFTNPFTHKARYSYGVYDSISGRFGTGTFRR